jgi:hypothetical protein
MVYHHIIWTGYDQPVQANGGDSIHTLAVATALYYAPLKTTKKLIVFVVN